jgi:serine/threonine protein kinase
LSSHVSHHIKHIAEQLLTTCAGLHQIGVVHADIKPENILLVDASYTTVQIQNLTVNVPLCTDIRIVDFGTAVFDNHEVSGSAGTQLSHPH